MGVMFTNLANELGHHLVGNPRIPVVSGGVCSRQEEGDERWQRRRDSRCRFGHILSWENPWKTIGKYGGFGFTIIVIFGYFWLYMVVYGYIYIYKSIYWKTVLNHEKYCFIYSKRDKLSKCSASFCALL